MESTTPEPREAIGTARRVSLADEAYRVIRAGIMSGRLGEGEPLVEARLAAELDTSRGPVREALGRLRDEGLIVDVGKRGVQVRTFTADDLVDLFNARIGLETVAVRLATRHRAPTEPLRALIERMRAAAADGDVAGLTELEIDFHGELCSLSGNSHVVEMFASVAGQIQRVMGMDNAEYNQIHTIADEHVPIADAIDAGDEDRAAHVLHGHIVDSVLEHFATEGSEPAIDRQRLLTPPA